MSVEARTTEPGSNAGQVGGGEQHQQTEEENMLDEIAKQKEMIDEMPGGTFRDMMRRAPHQKKLGQLEFKFHIFTEKKRLARALTKFEEVNGVLYSEPCLICLEDIHVHAALKVRQLFICCGGFICMPCVRNLDKSGLGLDKCPLCRESLADITASERTETSMKFAKRGVSWAQREVGRSLVISGEGCEEQEKAGLEWLNKSIAQNYPPATFELSGLHRIGLKSLGRKSQEKANELLIEAANLGYAAANSELAQYYFLAEDGFEKNIEEAYFRASVAFALDGTNAQAAKILGVLHFNEDVAEPSPYLACYYANVAAKQDLESGINPYVYSASLHKLNSHLMHSGQSLLPGSNAKPAEFFWLRKSRDLGYDDAIRLLNKLESFGQSRCANCKKGAQAGEKLKQCSKCKAQWYCSKECQVEAWRAGHKKDCKHASILNFEDYLCAE